MNVLDRILAGVTNHPTVAGGATAMLHNLAEQVRTTAMNPIAVDQMASLIREHASHIAAQIIANTPMQVVTVHPEHAQAIVDHVNAAAAEPAPVVHSEG